MHVWHAPNEPWSLADIRFQNCLLVSPASLVLAWNHQPDGRRSLRINFGPQNTVWDTPPASWQKKKQNDMLRK